MKYAVVNSGGKQYKVSEGEEILLQGTILGKTLDLTDVLLISNEGKIKVGNPTIKDAKVQITVIGPEKGEKINVRKYKSKSRYRKAIGHRAQFTRVKVDKIVL
ncbi:MAG: 50S ribosomal protein L21 [Patescibacteria group bacterium]